MLYIRLWFSVDGTTEYGQYLRWLYLWGYFGKDPKAMRKLEKLDNKNFKKWQKVAKLSYEDYLKSAMV